jgi:RNA polymerase primary sigma factor
MNISAKTGNYLIRNVVSDNYIREINRIPVMTKEEEIELFKAYEASQKRVKAAFGSSDYILVKAKEEALQDEIRNEVISRNQRFNFAVAKRYDNKDIIMDLVNVGAIGMYEAFQKYDYKTGVRFCTFAVWYIRRAINAFLTKDNLMIRTSNDTKLISKVKHIENKFYGDNGRYPSVSEIINILKTDYNIKNVDPTELKMVVTVSINDSMDSDDKEHTFEAASEFNTASASYNDYENTMDNDHLAHMLKVELKKLDNRERTIICMAYGYGYDKEYKDNEIAEVLNLTSERVRQIRIKTCHKMKQNMSVIR